MQKISLYSSLAILVIAFSASAHAATALEQIRADIAEGNFVGAKALLKNDKDPSVAGEAVLSLLDVAKKNVTKNPELSAQALQLAVLYTKDVNPEKAAHVKKEAHEILLSNKENKAYCSTAGLHTDVCQIIATDASAFLSDVHVAFEDVNEDDFQLAQEPSNPGADFQQPLQLAEAATDDDDDFQLAQQPTNPGAHFQQPLQTWLTPPNPPGPHLLASGF